MLSPDEIKKLTALNAAELVTPGMTIGLGTGSTIYWLIQVLGERARQGLTITAVPTSSQTTQLAIDAGITLASLDEIDHLALTIDGADEIDQQGQLIKGGGGALLQEKIVAAASRELVIIADSSKLVKQLGKFPLPVEVIPFGHKQVLKKIARSGFCKDVTLRRKNDLPYTTDHQHYILDCACEKIEDIHSLNAALHEIPGVVETGLFIDMASRAIIGYGDGRLETIQFRPPRPV